MTARALIDPNSADRLAKILGMLGSEHSGERDAAAQAADKMVRGLGLTWHDIIGPPLSCEFNGSCAPRRASSDWQKMARHCHSWRWRLSQRERSFIEGVLTWRSSPTEKQFNWLVDIYARLHERGAGR